jgi:uncharacterized protein YecT (DUF1311 family)
MKKPTNYIAVIVLLGWVAATGYSAAQDMNPDAEIAMQQCFETVRDIIADPENTANVSGRDCIGAYANNCMATDAGMSTIGMTACTQDEMVWWDQQLNNAYQHLKETLAPDHFRQLRDVQRKWIAYKDAACTFEYNWWDGGSIRQPLTANCFLQITADQAVVLGNYADQINDR